MRRPGPKSNAADPDCPICQGTGYTFREDEKGYKFASKCQCRFTEHDAKQQRKRTAVDTLEALAAKLGDD